MGTGNIHALKHVQFFGREVPIVLQNENGPCPLLALANILSLKNQIRLPWKSKHIDQDRLVAIVADFLVEANTITDGNVPEDYKVNLQQNLSDVMMVLPKLTTGIDVNVRFDDIRGFEFTNEIAIFDLMGISLVHGWLYDTEDKLTTGVINKKTYNQLVCQIVTALGSPSLSEAITPQSSKKSLSTGLEALSGSPTFTVPSARSFGGSRLTSGEERQLKLAFALSLGQESEQTDGIDPTVRQVVGTIFDRINSDDKEAVLRATSTIDTAAVSPFESSDADPAVALDKKESVAEQEAVPGLEEGDVVETTASSTTRDAAASESNDQIAQNADETVTVDPVSEPTKPSVVTKKTDSQPSAETLKQREEAEVAKSFLEQSSSQLTHYGLQQLKGGLKNNELAVFFRNNHFNTLFFYKNELYILMTDLGYMWERDLVWEHLSTVDGDTGFVKGDFTKFAKTSTEDVDPAPAVPPAQSAPNEDVDFALALQLQTEEEDRQRAYQLRQQQELQAKQTQTQTQAAPAPKPPTRLETQPQPVRPRASEQRPTTSNVFSRRRSKEKDCTIM